MILDDEKYMRLALAEAAKAYARGEIPIGAVLVNNEDGTVVSQGHNLRERPYPVCDYRAMCHVRRRPGKQPY